jgi:hypothetical protein
MRARMGCDHVWAETMTAGSEISERVKLSAVKQAYVFVELLISHSYSCFRVPEIGLKKVSGTCFCHLECLSLLCIENSVYDVMMLCMSLAVLVAVVIIIIIIVMIIIMLARYNSPVTDA